MAFVDLQEKENFTRLSRLLFDAGAEALRNTFDTIHPPVSLPAVLYAKRSFLLKLKPRVINDSMWDLLFPPSGNPPDSKTFDATLLTILLRNICGLHPPATGWHTMPPDTDNSLQANITRIKLFRNQVAHPTSTQLDQTTFDDLWRKISDALLYLNIPQTEIDTLKISPLGPEVEIYMTKLKEWELLYVDVEKMFVDLRKKKQLFQEIQPWRKHLGDTEKDSQEWWEWKENSKVHREKFRMLLEFRKQHANEVKVINGVRVCCSMDFVIGNGADGTRVYVGLGKDGIERAVKRLNKDTCIPVAMQEMKVLTESNTTDSKHVVNYWFLDVSCDKEYLYLILDLCEETLESYVDRKSREHLATIAPEIIQQILKGLADLHRGPNPILHRDLKPSNILRDVNGEWLLSDFGISRVLKTDETTHESGQRGTKHWRAVETYPSDDTSDDDDKVRYKKESDIQVAGMVAYYIVTKGKHPFGKSIYRESNLVQGNPVGLAGLTDDEALKDLLTWMLSHKPEDRPLADVALKHPYLQTENEQFEMLSNMGNQPEIKKGDEGSNVVKQLNSDPTDWKTLMDADVLAYFCTDFLKRKPGAFKYGSSWTECLRFIRNVSQHCKDPPRSTPKPEALILFGDPREYFFKIFPKLPVVVHRIVRSCDWKERPELQKYFK